MALKIIDVTADPTDLRFVGVSRDRLESVLTNRDLIEALAMQLVERHLEMFVYMNGDAPAGEGVQTFAELDMYLRDGKDSCHDYVCDVLGEFQEDLIKAIARTVVTITSAEWDKDGLKDVHGCIRMGADNA